MSVWQQYPRIAILGFGVEGKSTLAFLERQGVQHDAITILDSNPKSEVPDTIHKQLGNTYLDNIDQFACIIKSPGITKTMIMKQLGTTHIDRSRFTSQTQIFFDTYTGNTIGVTGTKGKSTTASLIALLFAHAGKKALLAGNVGLPILDYSDTIHEYPYVVYELSSFQLEALASFHVTTGICSSLYSTHIAEHGDYPHYVAAKVRLLDQSTICYVSHQAAGALYDAGHTLPEGTLYYGAQGSYRYQDGIFYKDDTAIADDRSMSIVGVHNRYNACVLFALCDQYMIDYSHAISALEAFTGLEHRIELVGTYKNIIWYNDAIATTPQATMAAIESFGEHIDTLFYGGIDGVYDHTGVAELIKKYHIRNLVLFPDTGTKLLACIQDYTVENVLHTRSMQEGVRRAATYTQPGSIALLSCGSPSFSCRKNFKEKGELFKQYIHELE